MSIKTLAPEPIILTPKSNALRTVEVGENSPDRDANGWRENRDEKPRRKLSEQEFEQVLSLLREHKGIQENHLSIEFEELDEGRIAVVRDPQGQIVCRIPEYQLRSFIREKESNKGHLFNKVA